jgi:hypothetical protein
METVYILLVVLFVGVFVMAVMTGEEFKRISELEEEMNKRVNFLGNEHLSMGAVHADRIDKLDDKLSQLSSELELMKLNIEFNDNRQNTRILAILDELDHIKVQNRNHLSLIQGLDKEVSDFQQDYSQQTFESTVMHDNLNKKVVGFADVLHAHITKMHKKPSKPPKKPIKKVITKKPKNS